MKLALRARHLKHLIILPGLLSVLEICLVSWLVILVEAGIGHAV